MPYSVSTTGFAAAGGEQDGDFGEQPVAVDVHDIRARECGQRAPAGCARRPASDPSAARDRRIRRVSPRNPRHRPGEFGAPAARGGCATYATVSPASPAQFPELPRQQRVGRLIGRQVRRDVEDVHVRVS